MLNIRIIGDEVLRREADKVDQFDQNLQRLADEMVETMHISDGIGLAAPQVGVSKRLLVTDISPVEKKNEPRVFVNPEIVESSGEVSLEEGCLSIPGVREEIIRPETIVLAYQDLSGQKITETFDGWMSRVLQHEIDHLNGILFTDYLSPVKQKLLLADIHA